ncbi:MAG TPA: type II secretion system F family protein [Isosphaeraceae bacterium]|nr:type II secretion system F family protein [Isosphaeraceae bacterium]
MSAHLGGALSGDDAAELVRQVAGLAGAGQPLAGGLAALAEELPRGRLRRAVATLAVDLERGTSFDDAIGRQGARVPPHLRGLVRAATRSGHLADLLARFAAHQDVGRALRRDLAARLIYPGLLLGLASAVFLFILGVVTPQLAATYRELDIPTPLLTRWLFAASRFLAEVPWEWVGPTAIVLVAAGALLARWPFARRRLRFDLPPFRRLRRWTALAEFTQLLALLLEAEVPLTEALALAGAGVGEPRLEGIGRSLAHEVEAGRSLGEAIGRRSPFPAGFARLLAWAEGHGALPEALRMMGGLFELRARSYVRVVGSLCNLLAVVLVLWGIGLTLVALFWPMWDMFQMFRYWGAGRPSLIQQISDWLADLVDWWKGGGG